MAELLYQGHASFRLRAWDGTTVYLDPYAGEGYDLPADGVLVTHEHYDHNEVGKVSLKPGARVLRSADFLAGGEYGKAQIGPLEVQAVPAYNKNHDKNACVGFVIRLEGKSLYFAGDTSRTDYMEEMGALGLDWAFLPIDGIYNMGPEEAALCAGLIGAGATVPIHTKPGSLYDRQAAEAFQCPGRQLLAPGETLTW